MSLRRYIFSKVFLPLPGTCHDLVLDLTASSDVLARHLQRCEKAQNKQELLPKASMKQTRAKSACNRCAKSKLKCDSQEPCGHCKCRSLLCKYTRQGYSDPYSLFRIGPGSGSSALRENGLARPYGEDSVSNSPGARTPSAMQTDHFALPLNPLDDNQQEISVQQLQNPRIDIGPSPMDLSMSTDSALSNQNPTQIHDMAYMPTDLDLTSMFDFPFESDPLLLYPDTMGVDFDYSTMTHLPYPSDESMFAEFHYHTHG